MRATLEQTVGSAMLITAALLIYRPYAAGLSALVNAYGIFISTSVYAALLALCGGLMLGRRKCGRWEFALLFLPVQLYAVALLLSFLNNPEVGPIGFMGLLGLSMVIPWFYSNRASRRERERE